MWDGCRGGRWSGDCRGAREGLEVSEAAVEAGDGVGEVAEEAIALLLAKIEDDQPEHCPKQKENEKVVHRRSADKYSMSFMQRQEEILTGERGWCEAARGRRRVWGRAMAWF